jgi:RimJ/RimL family protein N-acetyltransferase
VKLRELRREDLPELNAWRNDPEVVAGLGASFAFIGPEVDDAWFTAYLGRRHENVRLAILDGEVLVGCVYLLAIQWVHRSAEFAIVLGRKDRWRRGIGEEATRAALAHAFDDLQLERVWLHVNAGNVGARKLYEKVGFVLEGTMRRAVFKEGSYEDVLVMAVLSRDFRRLNTRK